MFRNDGDGKFTDISKASEACPPGYEGRGMTVLDFDGDCPFVLHNKGRHEFESASEAVGVPAGFGGLG